MCSSRHGAGGVFLFLKKGSSSFIMRRVYLYRKENLKATRGKKCRINHFHGHYIVFLV
jgi:hypothetical protein